MVTVSGVRFSPTLPVTHSTQVVGLVDAPAMSTTGRPSSQNVRRPVASLAGR